jgi:hypothetical protein
MNETQQIRESIENGEFEEVYYGNTGTTAYYDDLTGNYYNLFGQQLRSPESYNKYSEGYTPFGDE